MKTSGPKSAHIRLKATREWVAVLTAAHPTKTADHVAALIGEPRGTVKKWLTGETRPGGLAVLKLMGAYGPELAAAFFETPPAWITRATRAAEVDHLKREAARISARLGALSCDPFLSSGAELPAPSTSSGSDSGSTSPASPSTGWTPAKPD